MSIYLQFCTDDMVHALSLKAVFYQKDRGQSDLWLVLVFYLCFVLYQHNLRLKATLIIVLDWWNRMELNAMGPGSSRNPLPISFTFKLIHSIPLFPFHHYSATCSIIIVTVKGYANKLNLMYRSSMDLPVPRSALKGCDECDDLTSLFSRFF